MGGFGDFIRRLTGRDQPDYRTPEYIDLEASGDPAIPVPQEGPRPDAVGHPGLLHRLRPGVRREEQIAALQAGYTELVDMVRAIRGHLETQTKTEEQLLSFMSRVTDAADGLKGLGRAAEQQSETLQLIRTQMEGSVQHGRQMVDSLNRFNDTLSQMDQTSRATAGTLSGIVERMQSSERVLHDRLEQSDRRLAYLVGALAIAALVAAIAGFYIGFSGRTSASANVPVKLTVVAEPGGEVVAPPPAPAPVQPAADLPEPAEPEPAAPAKRRFLFFGKRSVEPGTE